MKKLIAVLLVLCMVLGLAACGGGSGTNATNSGGSNTPTGGGSKDPTTQNDPEKDDDPGYSDNEDSQNNEEETTEPSNAVTDLSDVPNPLGLNSLILAAYLNNAGTWNYSTGEIEKQEVTREMLDGISSLTISVDFSGEMSSLSFFSSYVVDAEENLYEYEEFTSSLDFVPDFSGDALEVLMSDLKNCELTGITLSNLPISDLSALSMFPKLTFASVCFCKNLTSLAGLEDLTELERLDCYSGYALEDISALANLTNLVYVDLNSNNITDLAPLANLINLETLKLGSNPITDMSPLANLPALESLSLGSTDIEVIPEGGTTAVTYLSFGGYNSDLRDVKDIAQWTSESEVVQLDIPYDSLDSFEGLEQIYKIDYVFLSGEAFTNEDMAYLGKMHVTTLQLSNTAITDLSALANNEDIEEITVTTPELTDISPLATCPNLTSINALGTAVTDLSCLAGMENLTSLNLTGTAVTDLSSLQSIPNLTSLWLEQNEAVSDVSSLANCPNLKYLYLSNCTGITDISPLAASTTLRVIVIRGLEDLDTSAFDGTEIEIRTY